MQLNPELEWVENDGQYTARFLDRIGVVWRSSVKEGKWRWVVGNTLPVKPGYASVIRTISSGEGLEDHEEAQAKVCMVLLTGVPYEEEST